MLHRTRLLALLCAASFACGTSDGPSPTPSDNPEAPEDTGAASGEDTTPTDTGDPTATATAPTAESADTGAPVVRTVSYQQDLKPLFDTHCIACHGLGGTPQGGLDLTVPDGAGWFEPSRGCRSEGWEPIPRVIPYDPDRSPVVRKVEDAELMLDCGREMPIFNPWITTHPEAVELLRTWIAEGAVVD